MLSLFYNDYHIYHHYYHYHYYYYRYQFCIITTINYIISDIIIIIIINEHSSCSIDTIITNVLPHSSVSLQSSSRIILIFPYPHLPYVALPPTFHSPASTAIRQPRINCVLHRNTKQSCPCCCERREHQPNNCVKSPNVSLWRALSALIMVLADITSR